MIPITSNKLVLVSVMVIAVFLSACTGNRLVAQTPSQTVVSQAEMPTNTLLPASTSSLPPTVTLTPPLTSTPPPTATRTPTRTPGPTATATPTWEPLPTLPTPSQTAKRLVQELFETNRGCLLPCWWGITPGQTSWEEARLFLEQFAEVDPYESVDQNKPKFSVGILVPVPDEIYRKLFPDETEVPPYFYISHLYNVEEGVVVSMDVSTRYYLGYAYRLSAFLQTYGPPDEIWLSTYSTEYPIGVLPFLVALFYPEQGILVNYFPEANFVGDEVHACQLDRPPTSLGLWASEQKVMNYIEAARFFGLNPGEPGILHMPIEEATEMDVQTFYETFKAPGSGVCLETPKELWPPQQ